MKTVRLPPEFVERIDRLRGSVPRERWVRERLAELLEYLEVRR
jgi:predicted DNA-binding protein